MRERSPTRERAALTRPGRSGKGRGGKGPSECRTAREEGASQSTGKHTRAHVGTPVAEPNNGKKYEGERGAKQERERKGRGEEEEERQET